MKNVFFRFWPEEMRSRIKSTYLYFTGSLGITAASSYYLSRSHTVLRMMSGNRWLVSSIQNYFLSSWFLFTLKSEIFLKESS